MRHRRVVQTLVRWTRPGVVRQHRAGNEHRKFIPTNVYPTKDGFVYLAVGSDVQWKRLTATPMFAAVATPLRSTNAGRHEDRPALKAAMTSVTSRHTTAEVSQTLSRATIPWAAINDVRRVRELPALAGALNCAEDWIGIADQEAGFDWREI